MDAHRKNEIAEEARKLRYDIWKHRGEIWPYSAVKPFDCLNPEIAAKYLGYTYESISEWGDRRFSKGGVVGLFNRRDKRILIDGSRKYVEQRFTAAHELGHAVLHGHIKEVDMHRERPIIGSWAADNSRNWIEREADYFACCFLIPEPALIKEFELRFGPAPIHINTQVAFWISNGNQKAVEYVSRDSINREMAIASCQGFGPEKHFKSLAQIFNVSVTAMAWRIKELELIKWP